MRELKTKDYKNGIEYKKEILNRKKDAILIAERIRVQEAGEMLGVEDLKKVSEAEEGVEKKVSDKDKKSTSTATPRKSANRHIDPVELQVWQMMTHLIKMILCRQCQAADKMSCDRIYDPRANERGNAPGNFNGWRTLGVI